MNSATYRQWWTLHARAALGEPLSPEEQAFYESGLRQLDQEETPTSEPRTVRETRATVAALQAENAVLRARSEGLGAEIAALEAALQQRTRQLQEVGE